MMPANEARVTQWDARLGTIKTQRTHIPLAKRMEKALLDGSWDGKPAEISEEDIEWLNMSSVGDEVPW